MSNYGIVVAGRAPMEPPDWEIPGVIPRYRVITRTTDLVVAVAPIEVYANCLMLTFSVLARPDSPSATTMNDLVQNFARPEAEDGWPVFSLEATERATSRSSTLHLDQWGGGNRGPNWHARYLGWPLPSEDLTIRARWSRFDLDQAIVVAEADLRAAHDAIQSLG